MSGEAVYDIKDQLNGMLPKCEEEYFAIISFNEFDDDIIYVYKESVMLLFNKKFDDLNMHAEILIDKAWEHLNMGHWKDVAEKWRKMYSVGTIFKLASSAFSEDKLSLNKMKELIRLCDMGLLMGVDILNNLFNDIIELFSTKIIDSDDNGSIPQLKLQTSVCKIPLCENNIKVVDSPSLNFFDEFCMKSAKPLIFNNCINHWPARTHRKWSFEYLHKVAGFRTVPVELGSKYTDESWSQKLMTITEFINEHLNPSDDGPTAYLAQHQLFDQIPLLQNDIVIPDYCCVSQDENFDPESDVEINAWFGPAKTVSPCHYDPKRNILVQVVGSKFIKLYPPSCSEYLYPHEGLLTNTSQVNVEEPNLNKFPSFNLAEQQCQSFVLNEGDMLYIPPKHWHYIRSLQPSMSVSFWW